ncbi:MAG: TonB-dependent receptor [Bacteroides sp.]|nr:TonB-dependent receptor [Bacteroides sp.]MCM1447106.1 TonB-dependent receptor [Bacteroides sp.]
MKRMFLAVFMLTCTAGTMCARSEVRDSVRVSESSEESVSDEVTALQEVVVKAVSAPKDAPFAVSRIKQAELDDFSASGQELPYLFARTPGVVAWSENGVGTGTVYMRMRGSAGSRINVTLDGVPLNAPEDQAVFWANMNSYASLLGSVQIQRGVGSSTNGDGAFGGSIAMQTRAPRMTPMLEVTGSYGSYGTWRAGGQFSTGLLGNHWVLDGAYHETSTDGYLHGTQGRSGSYTGGLAWLSTDRRLVVKYRNIGNFENTGQAWSGVTAGNDDYSLNAYAGVKTYEDLYDMGLGRFNSLYERFIENWDDPSAWKTERYAKTDGSLWDRTTDNYWQNHNILSMAWQVNDRWSTTAALRYSYDYGYYDEFRYQNKAASKFGLNYVPADGSKKSDFVRRKGLEGHTYGLHLNANYTDKRWDVLMGLNAQGFSGDHFGYLTYIGNEDLRNHYIPTPGGRYRYYSSDAQKNDVSLFAKATMHITSQWDAFADVQYRHVGFRTDGYNDKFMADEQGLYQAQRLDVDKVYNFLNPKVGLSWHRDGHRLYASYAMSSREPERNNFTDNGQSGAPRAERLHDVELGYGYEGSKWYVSAGLYYMNYLDQLVQTGELSDIGEALTTNIEDSYRMGLELSAGYTPFEWLSLDVNGAFSHNRILSFDEHVSCDWDDTFQVKHYDNSTLAFSPSVVLNGMATFRWKGFRAVWHTNFVSRQYLDNTASLDRSLPRYSTTAVRLSYTLNPGKNNARLKQAVFGLDFNNIFDRHFAQSGWVYSSVIPSMGYDDAHRYYQIGYTPSAGFTLMGHVTLRF